MVKSLIRSRGITMFSLSVMVATVMFLSSFDGNNNNDSIVHARHTSSLLSSPLTTKRQTQQHSLRADSELGQRLLSQARRVEDNNNGGGQNGQEVDMTWIADYAIKFQGCNFVQQFVDDQEGENNNNNNQQGGDGQNANSMLYTKSLVRFRLCPYDTCDDDKDGGCSYRYGEYIVGLDTFVNVYYEHRRRMEEYECELYLQQYCGNCEDNGDDNYSAEQCQYDCLAEGGEGMETMCMEFNPYENNGENNQGGEGEGNEIERYMECAEYEIPQNNNNGRRRLEDQQQDGSGLFIGPYCAEQGGAIYLGMFTNDRCTEFVDDDTHGADTYASYEGTELPFATESIVTSQCVSCMNVDQEGENNNNNNNDNANDGVAELCQEVYQFAGKCETNLGDVVEERNDNACSYIQGIQTVRDDGMIGSSSRASSGASTAFIVVLCVAVLGLGFYAHYLRTKMARRIERMNDPKQPMYPTEDMMMHCG